MNFQMSDGGENGNGLNKLTVDIETDIISQTKQILLQSVFKCDDIDFRFKFYSKHLSY